MLTFSCLFLIFSQKQNNAVLTLKDNLCMKCCFTTLCHISTFVSFLTSRDPLDLQVRANIVFPRCAKPDQRNSQGAMCCCSWQRSVCMKELRCFCVECKLGQLPKLSPDTTAEAWLLLLPPAMQIHLFQVSGGRTTVSDRDKVILIHLYADCH